MPAARDWEDTIRAVVSHALSQKDCRRGWTVLNHRGHVRLNIAAGAGRGRHRQVLLPIPWECDQIDQIRWIEGSTGEWRRCLPRGTGKS